ncbi:hypothetical protein M407DRAFT_31949 [Tulasnella calospora MUT 4182]|uniref:Uncharacterized protein n=1 Tax=Tulasnella calospora MUT 4182 TaxID=1051891 RepID=A0A0C3Q5M4_9AGAM|nr:hypothetical protein M407DRAFT_31949 [Tulasnella calospora MUT 4182]
MDATTPVPNEFVSWTSSIYALPPEIFTDIFLHLHSDPSIPRAADDLRNTHKLTFVMLVCKGWKDIVEVAPILWTDIWLGWCPPYLRNEGTGQWSDYIKARFARSGTLPLNLTIMVEQVNLEELSSLLLPHISRCKKLALRALKAETMWTPNFQANTTSVIHHILSSPLPTLQTIIVERLALRQGSDGPCDPLELDAPNLREIATLSSDIIPFVKPRLPLLSTHNSLERLSISPDWENILPHLPYDLISLPNLKFLYVAYTDHLWNLLQVIETPNLEHFVVNCDYANWPEEVDTVIPVMSNLRELEWYTDPGAVYEQPTLHHLLQHCPNISSFSYICNEGSAGAFQEDLEAGELDDPLLALSILLHETQHGTLEFCPQLRRLRIVCASFEQVRDLILLRPMLEHVSMQYRIPGDDIVASSSEYEWLARVNMVRWIRSKIKFEFPTDVGPSGLDLREEEGVFWGPRENLAE